MVVAILVSSRAGAATDPAADVDASSGAIHVYQQYLSDLRHTRCRFSPSCSRYAAEAIERYGLVDGSARAADRLMRCNASAGGAYPRNPDGTLRDPVGDDLGPAGPTWAPDWLRLPPEPAAPPCADTLAPGRRERLEETVRFADVLERRGDRAGAAIEFQRAGQLAGREEADAWAFDRIGAGAARAGAALDAEGAYLTAAMLDPRSGYRARAVYRAAVCRFDGGSYAACRRILDDRALIASSDTVGDPDASRPPVASVAALGGLAGLALGDWDDARARFVRGQAAAADSDTRRRIERLGSFVDQGHRLPDRSPALAGTMSAIVPGSGHFYCGRGSDGFRHLMFNALMILTTVSFARGDHVPAAVLTGTLALPFYLGNIRGAGAAARRYNRDQRLDLLGRAIEASAR